MFEIKMFDKIYKASYITLNEYEELVKNYTPESILSIIETHVVGIDLTRTAAYLEGVFIQLWAHSLGELNQTRDLDCVCGEHHVLDINYGFLTVPEETGFVYNIADIKIRFRYPRMFEDKDQIDMVMKCMVSVIEGAEEIPVDELSEASLEAVYALFSKDVIEHIIKELLAPKVVLAIPTGCGEIFKLSGLGDFMEAMNG